MALDLISIEFFRGAITTIFFASIMISSVLFFQKYKKYLCSLINQNIKIYPMQWRLFYFQMLAVMATCTSILWMININYYLSCLFIACGGIAMPVVLRRRSLNKFLHNFDSALIEILGLISSSLKAGLPLVDALDIASLNGPQIVGKELARALRRYSLGLSLADAIDEIRLRVKTPITLISIGALIVGQQLGGQIPLVLERITTTIRERNRVEGRLAALTAQGRTQSQMLCAAPAFLFFLMSIGDPTKAKLLTHTIEGQWILTLVIVLELMGIYAMRKIVHLDV